MPYTNGYHHQPVQQERDQRPGMNNNGYDDRGGERRTIVKPAQFTEGKPYFFELEARRQGLESPGQYGTQYLYFCGETMFYADQKLHTAIHQVQADGGNEIAITRGKSGRSNVWKVERLEDEPAPQQPAPAPPTHPKNPEQAQAAKEAAQLAREAKANRSPDAHRMLHCYITAIDLTRHVIDYARDHHGMLLTADYADIRAIAATLFIQARDGAKQ